MTLDYALERGDSEALARFLAARPDGLVAQGVRQDRLWRTALLTLILFVGYFALGDRIRDLAPSFPFAPFYGVVAAGTLALVFALRPRVYRRSFVRAMLRVHDAAGPYPRRCRLAVTDDGLVRTTAGREERLGWALVEGLAETRDYTFVLLRGGQAIVVPRARLDVAAYAQWAERVRARR